MSLIPGLPDSREIRETADTFKRLLVSIDSKLGRLLAIEQAREDRERHARNTASESAAARAMGNRLGDPDHPPVGHRTTGARSANH